MATEMAADSESASTVCYLWLIQTFAVSRTVFELLRLFRIFGASGVAFRPIPLQWRPNWWQILKGHQRFAISG